MPQSAISYFVTNYPRVALNKHTRFVEAVHKVKEMGVDPLKTVFVKAIQVVSIMRQPMQESKLELYKRWGWSRDVALLAFKRWPHCMLLSEEKITIFRSAVISTNPIIILFNLEKRIIPRYLVIQSLLAKGLPKNDLRIDFHTN